ncbi:cobyric acid synthase [Fervidicola ferrireducens]|uniref:cobyric acid synthase n=1 Tax=Fervidicola ferrireducens TaxID=520764 RepID=UPI000834FF03|nr:cobyric acid synthase [Fervidicola ferrireducens]
MPLGAKCIMIQGTGSSVGKSRIVTGLCRILKQDGFRVAPFKAQNMALNSYITREGLEIGRAQATQAEACGIEPSVLMNPVLLKPTSDKNCQVVLKGRVYGNLSAMDYHEFKAKLKEVVREAYEELKSQYEIIVIEGAGSPAEINLRENDIVNMGMAEMADAPVVIVGDIDRGGVFASLYGTVMLLDEKERERVKGVIINKFRGDIKLLEPGIKMLEDLIKKPVLGVVPYDYSYIDEEDDPTYEMKRLRLRNNKAKSVVIKILLLPHISNFTDFVPLSNFENTYLEYVKPGESIGDADAVIIPGTKNTIGDFIRVKEWGWDEEIKSLAQKGAVIVGICGGFQMLGKIIRDPYGVESEMKEVEGIGLLDVETEITKNKVTRKAKGRVLEHEKGLAAHLSNLEVEGYEIHMGYTTVKEGSETFAAIRRKEDGEEVLDGAVDRTGNIWGTYLHGIFDRGEFAKRFIDFLSERKGLRSSPKKVDFVSFKEEQFDKWASILRQSLDMDAIYKIVGIKSKS